MSTPPKDPSSNREEGSKISTNDLGPVSVENQETDRDKLGCVITAIACGLHGKDDDCSELQVLRKFRDGILSSTEAGKEIVDSYYKDSPALTLKALSGNRKDALWADIQSIVHSIEAQKYDEAIDRYKQMIENLKNQA